MKTPSIRLGAALAALLLTPAPLQSALEEKPQPLVQIALLLDTSGSMSGLIEQAKGQLWKIVNEFIYARQDGRLPEIQVALFEYGKNSLSQESGWIRLIQPLTNDLDKLSEELFVLQTNGGDEYCGWVIQEAVKQLAWNSSPDVYKAIFIAGNEPFTQGPVNYADACQAAIRRGIIVNTIHCGADGVGIETKWRDGAMLADGKYMFIDHNQAVVHFEAPQDKEIAQLGEALNKTYIPYGGAGREGQQRQVVQDANAVLLANQGSVVNRALSKASSNYCNSHWDLVDACKDASFRLANLNPEDLPAEMRSMNEAQRKAYVETKAQERQTIQEKINELNEARTQYVAEKMKQETNENTLDTAIIAAIREQAAKKRFQFQ